MMQQNKGLTLKHSFIVLIAVALWVIGFILMLSLSPPTASVFPTFWVFISASLLLLLLVIRLPGNTFETLRLLPPTLYWFLLSALIAILYWFVESFFWAQWLAEHNKEAIQNWHQSVKDFHLTSVWISSVVLAPVFEELYFRGLFFHTLKQKIAPSLAAMVSALFFALIHWSWPEVTSLFVIGLIYAWMTLRSNSIYPALLAHIIHNALTFWLYVSY